MTALGDPGLWLFPIAFVLIAIALAFTARDPGDLLTIIDFAPALVTVPAYMLMVRFADSHNATLVSWLTLTGSFAAVLMGSFEGFVLGAERASGNSSSIFFSNLGLVLGFLALTGLFAPHTRWRFIFALGPVLGTAAALMGGTRGSVIAEVALIGVFIVFAIVASVGERRRWLGATILVFLVSAAVAAIFLDTNRILALPGILQDVVAGVETQDASVNYRVEFYAGGLKSIGDSPIVGHGWWRRFEAAARYMAPEAAAQGLGNRSAHLHNDILNFGAGAGILGIAAYFLMIAAPLAGAWFSARDSQRTARLYAGSVLSFGFLAMGVTDSMFAYELPKTVFCMAAALILGFCRTGNPATVPLVTGRLRDGIASLRDLPAWTLLVFLLVLSGLLGTLSSVVAVVAALVFAAPALRRPGAWDDIRWQPAMLIFVAAFVILTLIFIVTARVPDDVRFSLNFLALLLAPVVYLMAREKPVDDAMLIMTLALVGAGASALLAVLGVTVLGLDRAQGIFGGPNLFPRVAIPLGFIAMAGALLSPSRYRVLFYLGPVFAIVVALLAASRGAALALIPLAILAVTVLALRRETRRDLTVVVVLALVAVAGVWMFMPSASVRLISTLASIGDVIGGEHSPDVATYERQAMLSAGWTAFQSAPLVGYGWANLGYAAALAFPQGFGQLADSKSFMFHNDAIDFAVAGGVVGLAVWLMLLAAPIAGALAAPRDSLRLMRIYGALVLSVSFFVFGLTDMTLGYDLTTTLYAFLTALLLGVRTPARN